MKLASILIGLTEEGDPREPSAALGYGLSLARLAQAHATVQAASVKLILTHAVVSDLAAGLVAQENRRLHALAEAVADRARGNASAAGIACTTETPQLGYHDLMHSFVAQARVHDLTVLDAEPSAFVVDRGLIETMLLDSGRPLIVVPPVADQFRGDRIIVAWDGSAKAARALGDAVPILKAAASVEVVCVTGEKNLPDTVPGADIAPHLARHGVEVTTRAIPAVDRDAAEALRRHAIGFGADMIVMGAFVHSRLRQMVLGGVTQSLLTSSPVPLFMAA